LALSLLLLELLVEVELSLLLLPLLLLSEPPLELLLVVELAASRVQLHSMQSSCASCHAGQTSLRHGLQSGGSTWQSITDPLDCPWHRANGELPLQRMN
jgi:hypothetical protein